MLVPTKLGYSDLTNLDSSGCLAQREVQGTTLVCSFEQCLGFAFSYWTYRHLKES